MKHFVNERADIVTEAIDAEVALSNGALRRLDGYPSIKVVVRSDWDRSRVAVLSGGGAGHEPAHAGFVGDGMLTAAVCGEIFASPSVDAVLAAILAVTGAPGCLLIVKNYTGDRLNFGLAAEKARALGHKVEVMIVGDDIALDTPRPRGVAGTLFVHKIAGHAARLGISLEEVKEVAEQVASAVVSIGVALTTCNIPGQPIGPNRIGDSQVEIGLGIHGEPGAEIAPWRPVRDLAVTMMSRIGRALDGRGAAKAPIALLINDLGGVAPIELAVATRSILEAARTEGRDVRVVFGPGRMMTSLDMKGFSVSALPLSPAFEAALFSAVGPQAWPLGRRPTPITPVALPDAIHTRDDEPSANAARRQTLQRICDALVANQADLDALDAKVGDGDTGTTLATAARAILADLDRLPFADASALCASLSDRLSRVMGGSSGILLAIFTAAMGSRVGDPPNWPAALAAGADRMEEYGGATLGDRTMLDALRPAISALETNGVEAAARAAADGAARTATMTRARAGRSSYVREEALRGVPDPGAMAVAAVFTAIAP